jgi:DNA-binding NtrC family response regulator
MKILVVDDDRGIVETASDILILRGHEPIPAYNGEEALEKVKSESPDCVLMDIKMPGINGVEALKRMKEISPALPVVLISAYATDALIEEARQNGANAVLNKPLDFHLILSFLALLGKDGAILVVDDDPNFLTTLKDMLNLRGFQVKTELEAGEVMGDLEAEDYLVVLLDLKLGSANGVDILGQIKETYPAKPVIMVTGYRQEMRSSIEKGFELGAYGCFYKPFEMNALLDMVEEIRVKKLKTVLSAS